MPEHPFLWKPSPGELKYWHEILRYPWYPPKPWITPSEGPLWLRTTLPKIAKGRYSSTQALDRAYKLALWLKNAPPTMENATTRIRAKGLARYRYWDFIHLRQSEIYQPYKPMLPVPQFFTMTGLAITSFALLNLTLAYERRNSQDEIANYLTLLNRHDADMPARHTFELHQPPFDLHHYTPATIAEVTSKAGYGPGFGLLLYIPRYEQSGFYSATAILPVDHIHRQHVAVLWAMRFPYQTSPHAFQMQFVFYDRSAGHRSGLALFRDSPETPWYYSTPTGWEQVPHAPGWHMQQGWQWYMLILDTVHGVVRNILLQNTFIPRQALPFEMIPKLQDYAPNQITFNVVSGYEEAARVEIDNVIVLQWGPLRQAAYMKELAQEHDDPEPPHDSPIWLYTYE